MSSIVPNGVNGVNDVHQNAEPKEFEVVVVGTGFGGIYVLKHLRDLGWKVKGIESGEGLGGVWWWNSYPGARVDTSAPFYEYSDPELWRDWNWKEAFPSQDELLAYFQHVDKKWQISKDVQFNTTVKAAQWDENANKWAVSTDKGDLYRCQHLILAIGFAARTLVPFIKGLETFERPAFHTAEWPKKKEIDFHGKRVGVIGTGASGVQVIQELAPIVKHLTVFQRTPNMALPMRQVQLDLDKQEARKKQTYKDLFTVRRKTHAGWDYNPQAEKTFDVTAEDRRALWEELWEKGGFYPWLGNYSDILVSQGANDLMYDFWREKVLERISRPEVAEDLAPRRPPHAFGAKRPSLEQRYWEVYSQSNVELVNLKKTPIKEVTRTSVITAEATEADKEHPLDILVLATGFDAGVGGITRIDIRGVKNQSLKDKWSTGTRTQLGMAVAGFPNLFFMYGPQSPCAFAVGPANSEIQGDWIIDCLESIKKQHQKRIEALPEAEEQWAQHSNGLANATLLAKADSWYMGANVPGKVRESVNYIGGLPAYSSALDDSAGNGYKGFKVT